MTKMHFKMLSVKWRPFCIHLGVLKVKLFSWCMMSTCILHVKLIGSIPAVWFQHFTHKMLAILVRPQHVNILRPRQNGRHFADDTFKRIFLNQNVRNSITISLKFVPKGPINNIPALVQIMAWRRSGDKPLSEPLMDSLLMHICVTRPQWVNEYMVWLRCICRGLIQEVLSQLLF